MKKDFILIIFALIVASVIGLRLGNKADKNQEWPAKSSEFTTPSSLEAQINTEGSVEVTVVPKIISEKEWSFEITFDTHSEELAFDLAKNAVLVDDQGNEYAPLAWEGDSAGGHHRNGILKFSQPSLRPASITVKISQVGGIAERNFTWQIK